MSRAWWSILSLALVGCGAKAADDRAAPAPATVSPTEVAPKAMIPTPEATTPVAPTPPIRPGHDFTAELATLWRVTACAGVTPVPERFPARVIEQHCVALERLIKGYQDRWLARARPFFAEIVPADVPKTVVYPFGGADLLTALAVYPDATEYTTLSLEAAGDPRLVDAIATKEVGPTLTEARHKLMLLMRNSHSRTDNLQTVTRDDLPGELVFSLVALRVHGYEPVGLRYLGFEPDGSLRYLGDDALGPVTRKPGGGFDAMELRFRRAGDAAAPEKLHRHIRADLGDDALGKDPRVLRHLEQKGKVAAMTKAASYLLWYDGFSLIRGYLETHLAWMVSDSTGLPPARARKAGLTQTTFGSFTGAYLGVTGKANDAMVKLWQQNPRRPLGFYFGYPDALKRRHLMITAPAGTAVVPAPASPTKATPTKTTPTKTTPTKTTPTKTTPTKASPTKPSPTKASAAAKSLP